MTLVLRARWRAWLRYWRSLPWWQAPSLGWLFDPVGSFSKPFVPGPNPILISYSGERDGDSEEVVAKPKGEERVELALAIGGPGSGGSPSACGGHCYGQRCPVRSRTSRPRSATRRTSGETPQSCHGILRQSLSRN